MSLDQQARTVQLQLRARMLKQLLTLWPTLDMQKLDDTFPAWALAVGGLVTQQHQVSAAIAAQFITAQRALLGITSGPMVLADPLSAEQIAISLRSTSVIAVKQSMLAGKPIEKASQDAFVTSSGAASRLVLSGGRDTVVNTVKADPRAHGYRRVTSGRACDYCASRAGVTFADDEVFPAHDHCGCAAVPNYR